jgi:hypothetical protein
MGTILGIIALICAIWVIYDVWVSKKNHEHGQQNTMDNICHFL